MARETPAVFAFVVRQIPSDAPPRQRTTDPLAPQGAGHSGLFVVFEGHEGTGKTTLLAEVGRQLREGGYPVREVPEFSDSYFGQYVRQSLAGDGFLRKKGHSHPTFLTQVFAILTDWMHSTEYLIVPRLREGLIVLKDRYLHSVTCCQVPTIQEEYPLAEDDVLEWLTRVTSMVPVRPDLTFMLEAPLAVRLERMRARASGADPEPPGPSADDLTIFDARRRLYARYDDRAGPSTGVVFINTDCELVAASQAIVARIVSEWDAVRR